jgi:hypothetical protein
MRTTLHVLVNRFETHKTEIHSADTSIKIRAVPTHESLEFSKQVLDQATAVSPAIGLCECGDDFVGFFVD